MAIGIFISVFVAVFIDPDFGSSLNSFGAFFLLGIGLVYFSSIWLESRDGAKIPKLRAYWKAVLFLQLLPLVLLIAAGIVFQEGSLGLIVIFGIFGLPLVIVGLIMMFVEDARSLIRYRH